MRIARGVLSLRCYMILRNCILDSSGVELELLSSLCREIPYTLPGILQTSGPHQMSRHPSSTNEDHSRLPIASHERLSRPGPWRIYSRRIRYSNAESVCGSRAWLVGSSHINVGIAKLETLLLSGLTNVLLCCVSSGNNLTGFSFGASLFKTYGLMVLCSLVLIVEEAFASTTGRRAASWS